MDPFSSPFARDQELIQERLDFESQKNIARNYLPLKPAMTTRQKFTEDNLNALKLREELETLKASFSGKCNDTKVDSMADAPASTATSAPSSVMDILASPVQMSTFMLILLIVVIVIVVMSYHSQVKQWRDMATALMTGNQVLAAQLKAAAPATTT